MPRKVMVRRAGVRRCFLRAAAAALAAPGGAAAEKIPFLAFQS